MFCVPAIMDDQKDNDLPAVFPNPISIQAVYQAASFYTSDPWHEND